MKVLLDPIYSAQPSRCASAIKFRRIVEDTLLGKGMTDVFFYWLVPRIARLDGDFVLLYPMGVFMGFVGVSRTSVVAWEKKGHIQAQKVDEYGRRWFSMEYIEFIARKYKNQPDDKDSWMSDWK